MRALMQQLARASEGLRLGTRCCSSPRRGLHIWPLLLTVQAIFWLESAGPGDQRQDAAGEGPQCGHVRTPPGSRRPGHQVRTGGGRGSLLAHARRSAQWALVMVGGAGAPVCINVGQTACP